MVWVSSVCPSSQIPLSCAITSANFTNHSRQWPKPLNLHSSVHTAVSLPSVMVTVSLFAGSQQSQDQTSRRSGSTGEKHNENGVRLHWHHSNFVNTVVPATTLMRFDVCKFLVFCCAHYKHWPNSVVQFIFTIKMYLFTLKRSSWNALKMI